MSTGMCKKEIKNIVAYFVFMMIEAVTTIAVEYNCVPILVKAWEKAVANMTVLAAVAIT